MKNVQKPEKIHLGRLIEQIKKGRYVIPDFQREFDWEPWDVRELIKSIFMDYYIGTLLLWEGKKENYKKLSCKPIFAFDGDQDPEYIVLDGQQRLTALHYAFFQPDENFRRRKNPIYYFIRLRELLEENFEEAFFYNSRTVYYKGLVEDVGKQYETHIFPLGVLQGGTWDIQKWIIGYQDFWTNKANETEDAALKEQYKEYASSSEEIKDIFFDILNDYQISYISLDEDIGVGKVCDIFTHINSKGVKLDTFDLLNAITRPKDIFLKAMYRKASERLDDATYPGFEMKSYILMVMSILEQNYCSPKYLYYLVPGEEKTIKNREGQKEKVVLIETSEAFVEKWDNAVAALEKGLKSLHNPRDFGAINSKFLPYPSIVPALSAIKAYVNSTGLKNKVDIHSKIRKWYWASIFQNRYSSSVESTSTKDFMDLKKWFEDDDAELESVLDFYREYKSLDLHREVRNSSAIYRAIFNLFIIKEARDWETFELPEYDSLDDHHIVPKSWGKENGLGSRINSILNRAPLSAKTNREVINNRLPNDYLREMLANNDEEKVFRVLSSHLISREAVGILLRDPFTVEDFEEFLEARKATIIEAIENILIKEKVELPENLRAFDERIQGVELAMRNLVLQQLEVNSVEDIRSKLPSHVYDKIKGRIERELRKNPALVENGKGDPAYWMQFSDLQELQQIFTSKVVWSSFQPVFQSKEKVTSEMNDLAGLRNSIRHSREVDKITQMKGEASLLWFEQQLKK